MCYNCNEYEYSEYLFSSVQIFLVFAFQAFQCSFKYTILGTIPIKPMSKYFFTMFLFSRFFFHQWNKQKYSPSEIMWIHSILHKCFTIRLHAWQWSLTIPVFVLWSHLASDTYCLVNLCATPVIQTTGTYPVLHNIASEKYNQSEKYYICFRSIESYT